MQQRSHEDYFSHWLQKGMEPILEKAFYGELLCVSKIRFGGIA